MKMLSRIFLTITLLFSFALADEVLKLDNFEVTLFSKLKKEPVNLDISMIFEGRDVEEYDFKIIDALNVVIGSFYAEDLVMSKGKEALKVALINYARDKYAIDIDNIYIQKMNILENTTAKIIIEELKKEGYIRN